MCLPRLGIGPCAPTWTGTDTPLATPYIRREHGIHHPDSRPLRRDRAMGIVHHTLYPIWMELGRSDLLRDLGHSYAEWEKRGVMMRVAELQLISRVL
jgi:hypothetical protein